MKFKVGDRVTYLNSIVKVTEIATQDTLPYLVEFLDGYECRCTEDDLELVQPETTHEAKTSKHYINIFDCGLFLYPADDGVIREWPCKGTIEIIIDKNGQLISAKNV